MSGDVSSASRIQVEEKLIYLLNISHIFQRGQLIIDSFAAELSKQERKLRDQLGKLGLNKVVVDELKKSEALAYAEQPRENVMLDGLLKFTELLAEELRQLW